jgi:hypothetical protein
MKKRILVLLTVVALMVVMMVVTVAPAFAAPPPFHPTPNPNGNTPNHTSSCAQDPTCVDEDVGQSHHERFPKGQDKFPPDTGPR